MGPRDLGLTTALEADVVQPMRKAFGEAPRVCEHDRRAMAVDEVGDAFFDVRPDRLAWLFVGGLVGGVHVFDRDDDRDVEGLHRRRLDDCRLSRTAEESGDLVDWSDGRRQPDALSGLFEHGVEPLERKREMRATLGAGNRVHLVDDHCVDAEQRLASCGREDQEQRLGSRDQNVGRLGREPSAFDCRSVAGPQRDLDRGLGEAEASGRVPHADQGSAQVAFDVDRQGLQRRDVEHPAAPGWVSRNRCGGDAVERPQEGRERLARARWRDDERVLAAPDGLPRLYLGWRGRRER